MSKWVNLVPAALAVTLAASPALAEKLGLGRPALPEEIDAWDVTVLPDGTGLRPGSGDVATGDQVFADNCAMCHGDFAEGIDNWPVLAGGAGTLTDRRPVKTVGSYWPHLSTVYDYIHRSMPFGQAQTLSVDDTYAIVAFLLYSNGVVDENFTLSNENFTSVVMPNADGFYPDDRPQTEYPQFSQPACMENCREPVKITKRAVELNVTPMGEDGKPAGTLPDLHLVSSSGAPADAGATGEAKAQEKHGDAPEGPDPALVEAGAKVFKKCAACHKVGEGASNGLGPVLTNVVGRTTGTYPGYSYSKAMLDAGAAGHVWTPEELDTYLANPKAALPGNKMTFAGLKKDEDRAAVIAFLQSLEK